MYDKRMIEIEVHRFIQYIPISNGTAKLYKHYICLFQYYCIDHNIDPENADPVTVAEWFDRLGWTSSTKHFAAAALRRFYMWKYGERHPMLNLRVKKFYMPPQRTLKTEEVERLLSSINTRTTMGVRDLAILTLMLDTGLRATEICSIDLRKLNLKNRSLQVRIKGGSWGEAVFFDYTANCISNWLSIRPTVADPEYTNVFVGVGGKTPGKKMTRYGLRAIMVKLARLAKVDHFSPHAMRRTFATLATENGAPTRLVQIAGRWRDIRMVETYTRTLQPEKSKSFP